MRTYDPSWPIIRRLVLLAGLAVALSAAAADNLYVGSKRFTESYILGELITQSINQTGEVRAEHRQGLGNTAIVFAALKSGAIQVYPDYTGTIALELLGLKQVPSLPDLSTLLAVHGLGVGIPLGFSNNYALAMTETRAAALGISTISDLVRHMDLRYGLSQEFLNRKDGWLALREAYGLRARPTGLDHGLAYEALQAGRVEVIDIYSTDAKIARYKLRVLADDRRFFPRYDAVLVYRQDLPQRHPRAWHALQKLEGQIPAQRMIAMNGAAELEGQSFAKVASEFLTQPDLSTSAKKRQPRTWLSVLFADDFWRLTAQHALLVFASLALSITVGVPLGIWAARLPMIRSPILGVAGVLQTIPSLALLAFLIAALDRIGTVPAIVALFLYGLLPIVRNTETGLGSIAAGLRQAGAALGFRPGAILRLIELPLALPSILAGIKTSAVINVGTATIAAFIGAGGYGERIVAGLAVNDHGLMLAGAIPAAAMALLIQAGFDGLEWRVSPMAARRQP